MPESSRSGCPVAAAVRAIAATAWQPIKAPAHLLHSRGSPLRHVPDTPPSSPGTATWLRPWHDLDLLPALDPSSIIAPPPRCRLAIGLASVWAADGARPRRDSSPSPQARRRPRVNPCSKPDLEARKTVVASPGAAARTPPALAGDFHEEFPTASSPPDSVAQFRKPLSRSRAPGVRTLLARPREGSRSKF